MYISLVDVIQSEVIGTSPHIAFFEEIAVQILRHQNPLSDVEFAALD